MSKKELNQEQIELLAEAINQNIDFQRQIKFNLNCSIWDVILLVHVIQYFLTDPKLEKFTSDKEYVGFLIDFKNFVVQMLKHESNYVSEDILDTQKFFEAITDEKYFERLKRISKIIGEISDDYTNMINKSMTDN